MSALSTTVAGAVVANGMTDVVLTRSGANLGYWLIEEKWALAQSFSRRADVVVLGDSSGNQGFNNAVFDELTGYVSVNLCTMGGMGVVGGVWLLERYLQRHPAPKRVLLVHSVDVLARTMRRPLLARLPSVSFAFSQKDVRLTLSDHVRVLLSRYARLYTDNVTLATLAADPRRVLSRRPALEENGFMPGRAPNLDHVRRDVDEQIQRLRRRERPVSEEALRAFERIATVGADRRFEVLLVNGPVCDLLANTSEYRRRVDAVAAVAREVAVKHGPFVYDARVYPFPATQMEDAAHVIETGSRIYTAQLAARMAPSPPG